MRTKEHPVTTLTPELQQQIQKAGDEPVRIEDPETHEVYVVIRETVYMRLRESTDQSDESLYEFEDLKPL
jgi:hypothetical protein